MSRGSERRPDDARSFTCVASARLWPYLLAVALLGGTLVVVLDVGQRAAELPGWTAASVLVMLVALAFAVAVVRLGADLQWRLRIEPDRLVFERGARRRTLMFSAIEQLGWEPTGSSRRALISAVTIDDDSGTVWRVPGLYGDGAALIDALVAACEREDVTTWCEALRLRRRMARILPRLLLAYAVLAGWLLAVGVFVSR